MLKPIGSQNLRVLAENAIQLAKIVRQWLPVRGDTETKTGSQRTAENWFYRAADHYTVCERIRNPSKKQPFGVSSGQYFGPSSCSPAWFELAKALDEIAVAYKLQGVSDETGCPHLPFEQDVPAIESGTLKRLELASSEILEAVCDEQAGETSPEQVQLRKIVVPENPDVSRIVNLVADGVPVLRAANEIAKSSEHTAGSLRTMYYKWKRESETA